jgi:hypothetical protein
MRNAPLQAIKIFKETDPLGYVFFNMTRVV